jgi:hypothetical protein
MGLTKPRAAQIFNLDYKQSTRVVTATNINLSGGAPSLVDGVSLSLGDRVLVTGQTTGSQNGLYYVTTVGAGSNGTWARTSDGNENGEIEAGMIVMVTEGTIYADTQWKLITDDPIVINTTALTFTQNYMANSISSGTSNVVVNSNANVTISSAGTANVINVGNTAVTFTGNLFPSADITYSLGNTALRWKDLWLSNSTLYIGDVSIAATGSALTVNGANVLVGNAGSAFSTSGNITGGNIVTVGAVSTTGNAYVGNILTDGYYYANGVIFAGGGGGGGGTPGGANTQIQYNNNGIFGGSAGLTFNNTTNAIGATGAFSTTGTVTAASTVGGVITGSSLSVTGSINGTMLTGTGLTVTTGNITAGNLLLSGAIEDSGQLDIRTTASNGNIVLTPNGTGNVNTGANINATGNVTGGNILTSGTFSTSGSGGTLSGIGNITGGNLLTGGQVSATGNIIAGGNLSIVGNIVDTGPLTIITTSNGNIGLAPNGTGNVNITGNVMPTANATANIGSATLSFNTIFAKATSAQYADLAEMYCADSKYTPGTVLDFGGTEEVTITTQSHSIQVAGIVSTNPSYLMNSTLDCANAVEVALVGRVPCHVVGTIAKGDRLVASSTPGIATRLDIAQYQPGCIIGKALESYDSETVGTIEVAVGRF